MSKLAKPEVVAKPTKTYAMTFYCMITLKNFAISNAKKHI